MKRFIKIDDTVMECRNGDIWATATRCYIKSKGWKSFSGLFVAMNNKLGDNYYQIQFGYRVNGSISLYPAVAINTDY